MLLYKVIAASVVILGFSTFSLVSIVIIHSRNSGNTVENYVGETQIFVTQSESPDPGSDKEANNIEVTTATTKASSPQTTSTNKRTTVNAYDLARKKQKECDEKLRSDGIGPDRRSGIYYRGRDWQYPSDKKWQDEYNIDRDPDDPDDMRLQHGFYNRQGNRIGGPRDQARSYFEGARHPQYRGDDTPALERFPDYNIDGGIPDLVQGSGRDPQGRYLFATPARKRFSGRHKRALTHPPSNRPTAVKLRKGQPVTTDMLTNVKSTRRPALNTMLTLAQPRKGPAHGHMITVAGPREGRPADGNMLTAVQPRKKPTHSNMLTAVHLGLRA